VLISRSKLPTEEEDWLYGSESFFDTNFLIAQITKIPNKYTIQLGQDNMKKLKDSETF
jgi:hypothetical protein